MKLKKRVKRSERLDSGTIDAFKNWVGAQDTKTDAEINSGISRGNIDRIIGLGRCAPATAEKIKKLVAKQWA